MPPGVVVDRECAAETELKSLVMVMINTRTVIIDQTKAFIERVPGPDEVFRKIDPLKWQLKQRRTPIRRRHIIPAAQRGLFSTRQGAELFWVFKPNQARFRFGEWAKPVQRIFVGIVWRDLLPAHRRDSRIIEMFEHPLQP